MEDTLGIKKNEYTVAQSTQHVDKFCEFKANFSCACKPIVRSVLL